MKARYKGLVKYEFHIPKIPGVWKYGEWRDITPEEWELLKNNKDFELKKESKKEEEV